MNNKPSPSLCPASSTLDLSAAVEAFVAQGGVIAVIPQGESAGLSTAPPASEPAPADADKLEQLKMLVAKGAGVCSLQYSLKMNRKEIRQLAQQHGIKINFSRPIKAPCNAQHPDATDMDDVVAGHAMHYSSLGYSVPEIARTLGLSVREVRDMGKAYRFEFRQLKEDDST